MAVNLLNLLMMLVLAIYYQLESMVKFFIRPRRKDVAGETVLITGAGSGIGQSLCIEFAKLGCKIVGWDISQKNLDETKKLMRDQLGQTFHSYICDISKREDVYEVAQKVKDEVGNVDILVNNAGIVSGKKILDIPDGLMQKTLEVNAISHLWTIKSFLPEMLEKNHGHIVTVASAAGFFGIPGQVDYSASKFAAVGLSEALYTELQHTGKTGVNVTCVCPYYINTGMFDGVTTGLIPILDKQESVLEIVDAVLRNKYLVMLPKLVYVLAGLKNLFCIKALLVIGKYTGVFSSMDDFVGRKKSE